MSLTKSAVAASVNAGKGARLFAQQERPCFQITYFDRLIYEILLSSDYFRRLLRKVHSTFHGIKSAHTSGLFYFLRHDSDAIESLREQRGRIPRKGRKRNDHFERNYFDGGHLARAVEEGKRAISILRYALQFQCRSIKRMGNSHQSQTNGGPVEARPQKLLPVLAACLISSNAQRSDHSKDGADCARPSGGLLAPQEFSGLVQYGQ